MCIRFLSSPAVAGRGSGGGGAPADLRGRRGGGPWPHGSRRRRRMPLTGGAEGAGAEQGTRRRPGTAAESGGRGQRSAAARQSGHDGVTPSSSSALLRRAPLPPAAAHRAVRRPRPAELPALPLPLALPPLPCGGLKCIRGERDCNFTSPLSSKALCLAGLVRLLDDMPRVNSGYERGKMRLRVLVGLSLRVGSRAQRFIFGSVLHIHINYLA